MSRHQGHGKSSPQPKISLLGRDLIKLLSWMVDFPEEVHIEERNHRGTIQFQAMVAEEDLGKVIGRKGRTVRAIRTLLDARASLDGCKYGLEIRET